MTAMEAQRRCVPARRSAARPLGVPRAAIPMLVLACALLVACGGPWAGRDPGMGRTGAGEPAARRAENAPPPPPPEARAADPRPAALSTPPPPAPAATPSAPSPSTPRAPGQAAPPNGIQPPAPDDDLVAVVRRLLDAAGRDVVPPSAATPGPGSAGHLPTHWVGDSRTVATRTAAGDSAIVSSSWLMCGSGR